MANIKSQKKRIRTNEAARMRNKAVKSELKTLTKHVQSAVAEGDAEKAQAALKTVTKRLDMAAAKHVIHKNQASNRKSCQAREQHQRLSCKFHTTQITRINGACFMEQAPFFVPLG